MDFPKLSKKYFSKKKKRKFVKVRKYIKTIHRLFKTMGYSPIVFCKFIWLNFLRKNTEANLKKMNVVVPTKYCVFDIHRSAKIIAQGFVIIGFSKIRRSKLETRIYMGKNTTLEFKDNFTFYAGTDVQLFENGHCLFNGGNSACNINCQIICADRITVGKDTLIGRNVIIRDYDAHYIIQENYKVKAPISIGNHCWIGEGAMIAKDVTIGEGAIVASRSWVTMNVKEKTFVAGMPARVFKKDIEWKIK